MNTADAVSSFSALGPDEKACFLALLAHELTIVARDTYEAGGDGLVSPNRMRAVNEVQHRLIGYLIALLKANLRRYPDDVLVRIVLEHPEDAMLEQRMCEAFDRALSLTSGRPMQSVAPSPGESN